MNPPSALHSAMGRDKKPFSYLPGGLDLSQIKSEKMAKRLMRNAMNPGVSETPIQNVQSPTTPTTPVLVPNFNCLPVQVFPTFNLPANPKSLLRTRSSPYKPKETMNERKSHEKNNLLITTSFQPKAEINNNTNLVFNSNNGNVNNIPNPIKGISRPVSMYSSIPEYEEMHILNPNSVNKQSIERVRETSLPPELKSNLMPSALCANLKNRSRSSSVTREINTSRSPERIDSDMYGNSKKENYDLNSPETTQGLNLQNEQTNIKLVEKTTQEKKTTETTEQSNGNSDAELTVTLPKKSIPKIETKVDVKKNVLPDGRVQEITTTTIKTTLNGKTEIKTKTETKTFPKEEEEYEEVEEEEEEEEEEEGEHEGIQIEEMHNGDQSINKSDSFSLSTKTHESSETISTKNTVMETNSSEEKVYEVKDEEDAHLEEEEQEEEEEVLQEEEEKEVHQDKEEKEILQEEEEIVHEEEIAQEEESIADTKNKQDIYVLQNEYEVNNAKNNEDLDDPETVPDGSNKKQEEEIKDSEENIEAKEEKIETIVLECSEIVQSNIKERSNSRIFEIEANTDNSTDTGENGAVQDEEEEEYEEAEEEVKEIENSLEAITKTDEINKLEELKKPDEVTKTDDFKKTCEVKNTNEQALTKTNSFEFQTTVKESFKGENRAKTITETLFSPTQLSENQCDSLRDVPIKLEKVEDIEIKPIGLPSVKQTISETTEIITSKTPASGPLSTQTELQRVENIVVQNKITTTLDRNYEDLTHKGIPTSKSYFAPSREHSDLSPQLTKIFSPSYHTLNQKEQRHSSLLDRLSVERQLPTLENYQILNNNNSLESQNSVTDEPRAEVLTVSNVKPSSVTNQHWFQQSNKENVICNNISTNELSQEWSHQRATSQTNIQQKEKPKYQPEIQVKKQPQPQYQPQPEYQPQLQSQTNFQPQYQLQPEYQQQYQLQPNHQPQYKTQPEYYAQQHLQPQYQPQHEYPAQTFYVNPAHTHTEYNNPSNTQYQYQPQHEYHNQSKYQSKETATETQNYQQPSYSDTHKSAFPSMVSYKQSYPHQNNTLNQPTTSPWSENSYANPFPNTNSQSKQYSLKENNAIYQNEAQNYGSSYVPPPWEQDSSYVYENTNSAWQSTTPSISNNEFSSWKPTQPKPKFTKPPPTAYIPPAPNQSFVKPVSKSDVQSKQTGRKTYYSEYERRYISVPEANYVPTENKVTHTQVDSTAQYYYDNDEIIEKEEPTWRKELREFSEKKFTPSYEQERTTVKAPWEADVVYEKVSASVPYTPTPTWSQTLKPRSSRETSFETEYVSQEWPRNNSVSRGRPLSSYNTISTTQRTERSRGVSVDRYNPNNYHSPIPTEHPPVQSHTLTPLTAPQHKIHSRQSRASAEPRELSAQNPRMWGESRLRERENPIQSRSFKYLQWITGTDE